MLRSKSYKWRSGIAAAIALFLGAGTALAQTGSIEGTVRNAQTSATIAGARVTIVGTNLATTTNQNGYYRLENVPVGTHNLQAVVLGYQSVTLTNARVSAGIPLTANFSLMPAVINLDAVVVTGVVGETQRAKLPFSVDQISAEQMPVPQVDALSAIQGKVAGAQVVRSSGRPGSAPTILLRGPTSIDASGRGQDPLFVVDGVILGSSMIDIDALDIETIEVVKGAAAASLYGSRAASGVIQITTRRGSTLADDEMRFVVRSEYGQSDLPGRYDTNQGHHYLMNSGKTMFIDSDGTECAWLDCSAPVYAGQLGTDPNPATAINEAATEWNTFVMEPWPGTTYDQVERFFINGATWQQYFAAEGRSGGTNFHASYSGVKDEGVMPGAEGFTRHNIRMNVDQRLGRTLRIGATAFYSQSRTDDNSIEMFQLTRMPAGVDLLQLNSRAHCDEPVPTDCPEWMTPRMIADPDNPGQFIQDPNDVYLQPDPANQQDENPLYDALNIDDINRRGRFLSSANVRFSPLDWVSFDANLSYDRLDFSNQYYRFKGYKTINPSTSTNEGGLSRSHSITEALNAAANITFTRRFGDLNTRTQFRYLGEWNDYQSTNAGGSRFAVADVLTIGSLDPDYISAGSNLQKERSDGYYAITSLDFRDRYILDAMVRNDGSSLFGPDERRQWYYRVGGAWRVGQDLQLPMVDELKLRYARGTAGGRPNFSAQYETYSVSGGVVRPVNLGNDSLRPELSTEQEFGVDMLISGRLGITVNYATTTTEDQILPVPLAGFSGFSTQWRNAGTLSSNTWEAMLDLQLVQTRTVGWAVRVLFDRTRNTIDSLAVPAFTYGVGGQGLGGIFYSRQGEALGTYYGKTHATSCDDLLGALPCDQFRVNDDGLLVWTGGEDLTAGSWGTTGPVFGFKGTNQTLRWGTPFFGWGVDAINGDTTSYLPLGKGIPDYNMAFSTTLRWGGLSVYALADMSRGFDIYNQPQQWALFSTNGTGLMDQTDVEANLRKPLGYYNAMYQATGGLSPSTYFIQDGSFVKLREVSLRYRFGREQLAGTFLRAFDGISISLIGRNLLTFSDYNSYDPEVGVGGGDTGSAAIARVDGFNYPNFRTYTAAIEVNF